MDCARTGPALRSGGFFGCVFVSKPPQALPVLGALLFRSGWTGLSSRAPLLLSSLASEFEDVSSQRQVSGTASEVLRCIKKSGLKGTGWGKHIIILCIHMSYINLIL